MYISRDLFAAAYQHLKHHAHGTTPSILILVALDTDALCAARILTSLLKNDYIPHKMHPVAGYKDLKKVNEEHIRGNEELRFLIVIGLGGMVQLADYLELQKDDERQVECWVIDSRRPWNLYNIFGENDQGLREGIAGCRVSGGRFGVGDKVGGIKCFDDGDIEEELEREGKAFRELLEMPVVDSDDEDEDDDDDDAESDEEDEALENGESSENAPENANGVQGNGYGRKRKSSENAEGSSDDDSEDEDGRDRSRRRKRDHRVRAITQYTKSPCSSILILLSIYSHRPTHLSFIDMVSCLILPTDPFHPAQRAVPVDLPLFSHHPVRLPLHYHPLSHHNEL